MTTHDFNKKMLIGIPEKDVRTLRCEHLETDLTIVGGGLSGVCAAITAARQGLKVVLIQDRPVLGGNASSEVRLWALGATSHMGNNNRWAREGGVINELLVENTYRNQEGNPVIFDTVILDKVMSEKNITLLLNTIVYDVEKSDAAHIRKVIAFNPQNEIKYEVISPLFCDASGDGIISYLSGASYRFGAEEKEEFGECFSPSDSYGKLLGHTIFFYPKVCDHPIKYTAPSFALKDITIVPKYHKIQPNQKGCNYWWFEYGGTKDTITDTEQIKFELWKVVYGAWNYIKNSGRYPEAENMTLEWVGVIPGKRESRRFEGLYMLSQKDIISQQDFEDAVAFGGWAIDLHPAEGVYSPLDSCNQYHSKGVYSIPYRCFVSRDIDNLFFAGRLISVSHVAFGSTRVMTTCSHGAQAVGMAAALCHEKGVAPKDLLEKSLIVELQNRLNLEGQSILNVPINQSQNKLTTAQISSSSQLTLGEIPLSDKWIALDYSAAQMLPLKAGVKYTFNVAVKALKPTVLHTEFRRSIKARNFTPDDTLATQDFQLKEGLQTLTLNYGAMLDEEQYAFVCFMANPDVLLCASEQRYTGVLSVFNKFNLQVNNTGKQTPPEGSGFELFEFWCPARRPEGENIAMTITPALDCFVADNLRNGFVRPTIQPNSWTASLDDEQPKLTIEWSQKQQIHDITLYFDTDYDHPMESVQYGHPEYVMPFCVNDFSILDAENHIVYSLNDNHETICRKTFEEPLQTERLTIQLKHPSKIVPASIFEIEIH